MTTNYDISRGFYSGGFDGGSFYEQQPMSVTLQQGVLSLGVTIALTGLSLGLSQGAMHMPVFYYITGQQLALSQGNLAETVSLNPTGQQLSLQAALLSPAVVPPFPYYEDSDWVIVPNQDNVVFVPEQPQPPPDTVADEENEKYVTKGDDDEADLTRR